MNCLGSLMNYSLWDLKKIMYEGQCEETLWMVKLGDGGLINSVSFKLHTLSVSNVSTSNSFWPTDMKCNTTSLPWKVNTSNRQNNFVVWHED